MSASVASLFSAAATRLFDIRDVATRGGSMQAAIGAAQLPLGATCADAGSAVRSASSKVAMRRIDKCSLPIAFSVFLRLRSRRGTAGLPQPPLQTAPAMPFGVLNPDSLDAHAGCEMHEVERRAGDIHI